MTRFASIGFAILGVAALAVGGCVHATRAGSLQHYTLAPPAAPGAQGGARRGSQTLRLARIAAPSWLAGSAMFYRLGYRDDHRIAAYAHSDWIAPPATLLEPILQGAIMNAGGWRAVVGPHASAATDLTLEIRLDDFSQAFARPDHSRGVIDASATLIDDHGDSIIAQRHFHIQVAAPSADAAGGARALGEASRQFAHELQAWLASVAGR